MDRAGLTFALALALLMPVASEAGRAFKSGGFCVLQGIAVNPQGAYFYLDGRGGVQFGEPGVQKKGTYKLTGKRITARSSDGVQYSGTLDWQKTFKKFYAVVDGGFTYVECARRPSASVPKSSVGRPSKTPVRGGPQGLFCYTHSTEYSSISRSIHLDGKGGVTYQSAVSVSGSRDSDGNQSHASSIGPGNKGTYEIRGAALTIRLGDGTQMAFRLEGGQGEYALVSGETWYTSCR